MYHFTRTYFLLLAFLCSLTAFSVRAEVPEGYLEIQDYLEPFAKENVHSSGSWGDPTGPFVPPLGWSNYRDEWVHGNNTYTVAYTATSSGKEGYCIGNTDSQLRKAIGENVYHEMYDLLITPLVKGKVNFWLKPYSINATQKPCVSLFKVHKTDEGFTFDAVQDSIAWAPAEAMTSVDWYQQEINLGDEYEYIGIRLQRVYFDEFKAVSALIPENRTVKWGGASMLPGYTANGLKANAKGNVAVGISITLTNTGNVAIPAGKKAKLMRVESTSPYTVAETPLGETPLPQLQPGESGQVAIETIFKVPSDIPLSDGKAKFRVDFWEDFTGIEEHENASDATQVGVGPTLEISPYSGILNISYSTRSTAGVEVTKTLTATNKPVYYGAFKDGRSKVFTLRNSGAAPLVIESLDKPDWIELPGLTLPLTIEPEENADVTVRITGDGGVKSGSVKFNFDGYYVANTIPVSGEMIPSNHFFADFEQEGDFALWYAPTGSTSWSVENYDSSLRSTNESIWLLEPGVNDKYLRNNRNDEPGHALYSPKMSFAEGDSITFYAAKRMAGGAYTKVIVAYSKDRSNWTELGTITPANDNPDLEFYYTSSPTTTGQYIYKRFKFDMPAGEYYISFTCGNSNIDNFHGGELCNVGVDIISESASAGYPRIVNHPLSFEASFKNLNVSTLLPAQQRVMLYADGEVVATAQAEEIASFETVDYNFEYYPHKAGETVLRAEVMVGEERFSSAEVTVIVQPETLETMTAVGTATESAEKFPLDLYYKFAKSEFVYTAADLASMEGSRILRISYPYYKTTDTKKVGTFKIWMQNTSDLIDETVKDEDVKSFTPESDMTLVYEGNDIDVLKGGSDLGDMLTLEFMLDTPFDYEGGNLRIVVEGLNIPFAHTFFGIDGNRKTGRYGLYKRNDSEAGYRTATIYAEETFPVVNLFTEKVLNPVKGTVKDSAGTPISGAAVKAVSGEVLYEAVTGIDGAWQMVVYQDELDYTLTAEAEGYRPYTGVLDLTAASNDIVLESMASDLVLAVGAAYDGYSVEGLMAEVYPLDYEGFVEPQAIGADGKAVFPLLPYGEYAIYINGEDRGLEAYENIEYSHSGSDPYAIVLDEQLTDPFNLNETIVENEEGTYDVTIDWNRRGDFELLLPYEYELTFNKETGYTVTGNSFTFTGVPAGDYVVTVQGTGLSGRKTAKVEHSFTIEKKGTAALDSIEDERGWRYFNTEGIEMRDTDRLAPGIYLRVKGNTTEKILIK